MRIIRLRGSPMLQRFLMLLVVVACWLSPVGVSPARALPAEIEVDRLVLAAQEKLGAGDHAAALGFLERVPPLEVTPPVLFHFLHGKSLFLSGRDREAKAALETYVEKAGRQAASYDEALGLLTRIEEQATRAAASASAPVAVPSLETDDKDGSAYDSRIRSLYLGMALRDALVAHINTLLRDHARIPGRIKATPVSAPLQYRLSLQDKGDLAVYEVSVAGEGARAIHPVVVNAFGISPFIAHRCSKPVDSCFIINPADGSDWMRLAHEPSAAAEVAMALQRLVRSLQRDS